MNFTDLQKNAFDLISALNNFADGTVFKNSGDKNNDIAAQLDMDVDPSGAGYSVSVWPPARGHSDSEMAGLNGVDAMIIVRLEVNPKFLAQQSDGSAWVNTAVAAIVNAMLSKIGSLGNPNDRYTLAADAFELVNFDEGLLAYHIRFARFCVFGQNQI